ncbi:DUF350 domain-containing protein [Paenibacillus medicaginis]|uniref:DUF350 domain-containing protein n=1 Tax=Paenibacillus medicaginis TaxID=1470560 RepID=A0ABV5BU78_9BACL
MDLQTLTAMFVWTVAGAVLLFVLMFVDSLFTKYKDFEEVKNGNMAVTSRMILKLIAQGYILSGSIATAYSLGTALLYSVVAFVILLIMEAMVRILLRRWAHFDLDEGTQQGKLGYGLFSGTLHLVGAFIITACF